MEGVASVIITAFTDKRWSLLTQAVESVQAQTVPARELIVVIDHNPALLIRAKNAFAGVKILSNVQERGLSGARNCGVAEATGSIIAFLDDDAIAAPDWLANLLKPYDDAQVLGVGGWIEPAWEALAPPWFPAEFLWTVGCTYRGIPAMAAPVRNLIGCNMSFRCEAFANSIGFRSGIGRVESKPLGCEETEFCINLHQLYPDKVLMYQPTAKVKHHVPNARANLTYFVRRCFFEGQSKALVSRLVGAADGLSAERKHTMTILPSGIWRGLSDALHGDLSGLGRASAIVIGLVVTAVSYAASSALLEINGLGKSAQSILSYLA